MLQGDTLKLHQSKALFDLNEGYYFQCVLPLGISAHTKRQSWQIKHKRSCIITSGHNKILWHLNCLLCIKNVGKRPGSFWCITTFHWTIDLEIYKSHEVVNEGNQLLSDHGKMIGTSVPETCLVKLTCTVCD